jgi:hypothetical protein
VSTLARQNALFERHLRDAVRGARQVQRHYQMMAYHLGWLDEELREHGRRLVAAELDAAIEQLSSGGMPHAATLPLLHFAALLSSRSS